MSTLLIPADVAAQADPLMRGLLAWYPLNRATGGKIPNAVSNRYGGTVSASGAVWGTSPLSGVRSIRHATGHVAVDGSKSDYFMGTQNFTMSIWAWNSQSDGTYSGVMSIGRAFQPVELEIRNSGTGLGIKRAGNEVNGPSNVFRAADGWIHAVATYDGTTLRLYHNAKLVGSVASGSITTAVTINWYIGRDADGNQFNGHWTDARIYNRALPPSEVRRLHRESRAGYPSLRRRLSILPVAGGVTPSTSYVIYDRYYRQLLSGSGMM